MLLFRFRLSVRLFIYAFLMAMETNYASRYSTQGENAVDGWRMAERYRREYEADAEVRHIRIEFAAENWWKSKARSAAVNSGGRFNNNSD
jgi:hypothetical protein